MTRLGGSPKDILLPWVAIWCAGGGLFLLARWDINRRRRLDLQERRQHLVSTPPTSTTLSHSKQPPN